MKMNLPHYLDGKWCGRRAGIAEATSRGLTEQETAHLRRLIEASANDDPVNHLISVFKGSGLLSDLRTLVAELDQTEEWEKIAEYGKLLLDKTDDLADAQRYAGALYNLERQEEVLKIFDRYHAPSNNLIS